MTPRTLCLCRCRICARVLPHTHAHSHFPLCVLASAVQSMWRAHQQRERCTRRARKARPSKVPRHPPPTLLHNATSQRNRPCQAVQRAQMRTAKTRQSTLAPWSEKTAFQCSTPRFTLGRTMLCSNKTAPNLLHKPQTSARFAGAAASCLPMKTTPTMHNNHSSSSSSSSSGKVQVVALNDVFIAIHRRR